MSNYEKYAPLLECVEKPGRYVGGEYSSDVPNPEGADLRDLWDIKRGKA